ncbi:MAG: SDR family oxidoreductase [Gemmatimonadota bacterium]
MSDLYLVTGGAGFIGNHIVRALLARGDRVRVLDNFSTGSRDNLADLFDDIELIEGDLRSADACRRAVRGVTAVLHQAALPSVPRSIEDPITTHEVNASGTLQLLHAAREAGVSRFVYGSSSSIYGPVPKLPREESDRPHPISPYAVAKLAGEQYCAAFYHSYGLETVALRYFNVFGPRQRWDSPYAAVVPLFIRSLTRGEEVRVFGDGNQVRDFTYVHNVVQANLLALSAPAAPGHVYNIGGGKGTTVMELLRMVATTLRVEAKVRWQDPRPADVRDSLADISRAQRDLGYQPTVAVAEGIVHTVAAAIGDD